MGFNKNNFSPKPYQNLSNELLHSGVVAVTGSLEVDLGLGHANFVVHPSLYSGLATDANKAAAVSWAHVTGKPGVFKIFAWKATGAGDTTLIAATAAVNISFLAQVDSSVG